MKSFLIGTKIGMTRFYREDGTNVPVTVIEAGPCTVTQVKTADTDGYAAVQLGFGEAKARRTPMPQIGHDMKAGVAPRRVHREFRLDDDAVAGYELGQTLDVNVFEGTVFVDVTGQSKGKGFQGGVKRHGFKGQPASHGIKRVHRSPGSIGGHATNLGTGPKLKKGKRMSGHMGDEQVTMRSLDVVSIQPEKNLILVKGPVPGSNGSTVFLREAIRLHRTKATAAAAASS